MLRMPQIFQNCCLPPCAIRTIAKALDLCCHSLHGAMITFTPIVSDLEMCAKTVCSIFKLATFEVVQITGVMELQLQ